uniref:Uncharacterized protein n=1 Tax=viral metagenome TaxID=1070528 RepID=A0A6C0BWU4_9ZZZZ
MKYRLVNGDYVEVAITESGRVQAIKYDKTGIQKMNTFNVSKENTSSCQYQALLFPDNSFIVVWLQRVLNNTHQICIRRYTQQGLAKPIVEIPMNHYAIPDNFEISNDSKTINFSWLTIEKKTYNMSVNMEGTIQSPEAEPEVENIQICIETKVSNAEAQAQAQEAQAQAAAQAAQVAAAQEAQAAAQEAQAAQEQAAAAQAAQKAQEQPQAKISFLPKPSALPNKDLASKSSFIPKVLGPTPDKKALSSSSFVPKPITFGKLKLDVKEPDTIIQFTPVMTPSSTVSMANIMSETIGPKPVTIRRPNNLNLASRRPRGKRPGMGMMFN